MVCKLKPKREIDDQKDVVYHIPVTPVHLVTLEKQETNLQHENANTNTISKPRRRKMEWEIT